MCQFADKLYAAVRTLAGEGTLKQRLVAAYVEHLEPLPVELAPDGIQPRLEALRQAMSAVPPTEKETAVQVAVRKMSQAEAARHTRSILLMFAELVRVKSTGERVATGDNLRPGAFTRVSAALRVPTFLSRS